jgi:hypothetical protein
MSHTEAAMKVARAMKKKGASENEVDRYLSDRRERRYARIRWQVDVLVSKMSKKYVKDENYNNGYETRWAAECIGENLIQRLARYKKRGENDKILIVEDALMALEDGEEYYEYAD